MRLSARESVEAGRISEDRVADSEGRAVPSREEGRSPESEMEGEELVASSLVDEEESVEEEDSVDEAPSAEVASSVADEDDASSETVE